MRHQNKYETNSCTRGRAMWSVLLHVVLSGELMVEPNGHITDTADAVEQMMREFEEQRHALLSDSGYTSRPTAHPPGTLGTVMRSLEAGDDTASGDSEVN